MLMENQTQEYIYIFQSCEERWRSECTSGRGVSKQKKALKIYAFCYLIVKKRNVS